MAWGDCIVAAALLLLLLEGGGGGVHCLVERGRRAYWQRRYHLRSRAESGATILELRHHSFSSGPGKSREEGINGLLSSDAARVSSLQWRIDNYRLIRSTDEASKAQVPITSGAKLRTLNYIATIGLGSDEATVIVDTASELTWVQCKPCDSCHNQQEPLFDPSSSPSYATVPCNSSSCDVLQIATGMSGMCGADQPTCSYTLSYRMAPTPMVCWHMTS